jgi:hypothetical protein
MVVTHSLCGRSLLEVDAEYPSDAEDVFVAAAR